MRLLELGLGRFGPFRDRRLAFRADARLHVVYGANEAGKSTALAAITDLLYGIGSDTPYDFAHRDQPLLLSAEIADRTGRRLSFNRRKTKPRLSDADGREIGPEVLAPFLGGVARPLFLRAFGLDAERLRQSGDELRDTDGELGAALFSAGAGLRGLETLKAALARETEELFLRNGKQRAYNRALARLKAARTAEREAEITQSRLRDLYRTIAEAEGRLGAIATERRAVEAERARLDMLRRARPLLAKRRQAVATREALGDLPAAEAGAGADYLAARTAADSAAATATTALDALARAEAEAAALTPETALIAREATITALVQEAAALRKAARDLPALEADIDRLAADLADAAARLGLRDGEAVAAARLDDGALARLASLLALGRRRADAVATARAARQKQADEQAREAAAFAETAAEDPRRWREAFAALALALEGLAAAAEARAEIAAERAALAEEARRLDPAIADLDALAGAALPGRAAIDAAATVSAEHLTRCREAERERDRAETDRATATEALAAFDADADLPTVERIAAARAARDGLWRAFVAGDGSRRAAYEAAVAEADRLADAAVLAAERVGAYRRARLDLDAATRRLAAAEATLTAAQEARAVDRDAWGARWAALGIRPATPEAMRGWRADVDALLARRATVQKRQASVDAAEAAGAAIRPALDALAETLGLLALPDLPETVLAARVADALQVRERDFAAQQEKRGLSAGRARALAEATAAEAEAEAALAAWWQASTADLALLGCDTTRPFAPAALDEAEARLVVWRAVPERLAVLGERRRRRDQLTREAAAFSSALTALIAEVAPELAGTAEDAAIAALDSRLARARETATRLEAAERRRDEARLAAEAATQSAERATAALTACAARLACADDSDLTAMATALAARDDIAADLAVIDDQIGAVADGADPEALTEALAALPDAEHAARIAAEDARRSALEDEAGTVQVALERAKQALADGGDNRAAEIAAQDRRMAEADLAEIAESWLTLALAGTLLSRAIEVKRGADVGPMLKRAGTLFAGLTGGRFADIAQHYDDKDRPLIVGRRGDGSDVHVAGLSEATRDQLFLALRLAWLERFAGEAEPPPFIGDDLFASFDDERTRHGLVALTEIGATVQPILFTHHRRVAEMATELGGDVEVIEL